MLTPVLSIKKNRELNSETTLQNIYNHFWDKFETTCSLDKANVFPIGTFNIVTLCTL